MAETPAEEPRRKDWMETWYETGDITWQKPLSPEAEERIRKLCEGLVEGQGEEDASA